MLNVFFSDESGAVAIEYVVISTGMAFSLFFSLAEGVERVFQRRGISGRISRGCNYGYGNS